MSYRVRNRICQDDPYFYSKSERQWRRMGIVPNSDAHGERMWTNGYCQKVVRYYSPKETRPATPEEMEAWKEEKRRKAKRFREKGED